VELDLPLFPSYLFVKFEPRSKQHYTILNMKGVVGILGSNDKPTPVSEQEIDSIRKVLLAGPTVVVVPKVINGIPVRVTGGPLSGVEGVVQGHGRRNRVFVGVASISQSLLVEVNAVDVQPI